MAEIFMGKVFVLVTGASRGIGKSIAKTFAGHLEKNSRILLIARNAEDLKKISHELPKGLVTSYKSIDFSETTTEALQETLLESLKGENPESFDQAIIVHCAAMVDYSKLTAEMTDFDEWRKFFNLNTFSPAVLNGVFARSFESSRVKKYVINISSYWGLTPDAYVGSYCAAKAAKDMFFKVFALENPEIRVLNYLPGFVETDMFYDALKKSKNEELRAKVEAAIQKKTSVTPAQTAECLVRVLKGQQYQSGDHVDYYKINQ